MVQHYEIPGSDGALAVGAGSWPMFHHDASLTGVSSPLPDLGTVTPVDVTAQAGNAQVSLSWTAPSAGAGPASGYNVYAGTAPGRESSNSVNGTSPLTGTAYTVSGLSNGTTYYFEVTAVNSAGEGPRSSCRLLRRRPPPRREYACKRGRRVLGPTGAEVASRFRSSAVLRA